VAAASDVSVADFRGMLSAKANPAKISTLPQSIGKTVAGVRLALPTSMPQEIAPGFCDRKTILSLPIGTSSFYIRFAKITVL
jgi:hypothetical protein